MVLSNLEQASIHEPVKPDRKVALPGDLHSQGSNNRPMLSTSTGLCVSFARW